MIIEIHESSVEYFPSNKLEAFELGNMCMMCTELGIQHSTSRTNGELNSVTISLRNVPELLYYSINKKG